MPHSIPPARQYHKPGTASKLRVAYVVNFLIPTSAHCLSKPSALLIRSLNLGKSTSSHLHMKEIQCLSRGLYFVSLDAIYHGHG